MTLKIYKTLWGWTGTQDEAIESMEAGGFDGVEGAMREGWAGFFREQDYIGEVVTGGDYVPLERRRVSKHLDDLRQGVERCLEGEPRLINVLGGCDWWSLGDRLSFVAGFLELEKKMGVPLSLETHRSRMTYNPWSTVDLLREMPSLKLTCDFSHWCCVTERLVMDEEPELLEVFARRCRHVHARVGYDQGPQVPDPRVERYSGALGSHLDWWRSLWESAAGRGQEFFTMTPEFGPDGYQQEDPRDGMPVGDLENLNAWMATRLRKEFAPEHRYYQALK